MNSIRFAYDDLARLAAPVIAAALKGNTIIGRECLDGWYSMAEPGKARVDFHVRCWVRAQANPNGRVSIEIEGTTLLEEEQRRSRGSTASRKFQ